MEFNSIQEGFMVSYPDNEDNPLDQNTVKPRTVTRPTPPPIYFYEFLLDGELLIRLP